MKTMPCHGLKCPGCGSTPQKAFPEYEPSFYFCLTCQEEYQEHGTEPDRTELIRVRARENHFCRKCGQVKEDVEDRYSFGVYAGRFCIPCCSGYRDNCGVGQDQGDPADLDEPYDDNDQLDNDPNYSQGTVRYGKGDY
jgi:hypothetical protein